TVFQQGAMIMPGSELIQATLVSATTLADYLELTEQTLLPAGTIIKQGSFVASTVTNVDQTIVVDTVFDRGTVLARGSFIASKLYEAQVLAYAIVLTPGSTLSQGTTLSIGSERVNTTLRIQDHDLIRTLSLVNLFMEQAYIFPTSNERVRIPSDSTILVKKGSFIPSEDGRLAALCPPVRDPSGLKRDGSIVGLFKGDHDIHYNGALGDSVLSEVVGTNFGERAFVISNCDETMRT
ncbi:MAG: hypothetical protein WBQ73_01275, partial [Candidatus Babeliales bacterium]